MDMNEVINQLSNNPQMAAQLAQMMQQNGTTPPNQRSQQPPMNWNMPTNPMAAMWLNTMMNSMNNMNTQNNLQPIQNVQNQNIQQQSTTSQPQQMENRISSVRVVKSSDEIKADEIPMDNSISLFLQDDLSVIYGKRWTNNGIVDTMYFVRKEVNDQNVASDPPTNSSMDHSDFDPEAFTESISKMMDEKLDAWKSQWEESKKENSLDKRGQTKSINNKKGVSENE